MTNHQTRVFYLNASKRLELARQAAWVKTWAEVKVPFYMTGEEKVFFTFYVGLAVAVCAFAVYLCLA